MEVAMDRAPTAAGQLSVSDREAAGPDAPGRMPELLAHARTGRHRVARRSGAA
jgi:hypothetical protein